MTNAMLLMLGNATEVYHHINAMDLLRPGLVFFQGRTKRIVLYAYGRLGLNNTITGLVLAHTALATPLVMIVITAALRTYDLNQERVARSLGATRLKAFFVITLPQIQFSILTAALLSFLISFDEVIIAIFVSGGVNATLTKQMFSALRDFIDPTIAAISTIIIFVSTSLLLATQFLGSCKK